jgi:hypothetical protein
MTYLICGKRHAVRSETFPRLFFTHDHAHMLTHAQTV